MYFSFQTWNSLSRLQRSLIYFFLATTALVWFYIWINSYKSKESIAQLVTNLEENSLKYGVNDNFERVVKKDILTSLPPQIVTTKKKEDTFPKPVKTGNGEVKGRIFAGPSNERQQAVVGAFRHAWSGYKKYAWGHDMLKPISKTYHDWFGLGLTLVDALDTMYIMNLKEEFKEAANWVIAGLDFDINREVNLFEVSHFW